MPVVVQARTRKKQEVQIDVRWRHLTKKHEKRMKMGQVFSINQHPRHSYRGRALSLSPTARAPMCSPPRVERCPPIGSRSRRGSLQGPHRPKKLARGLTLLRARRGPIEPVY